MYACCHTQPKKWMQLSECNKDPKWQGSNSKQSISKQARATGAYNTSEGEGVVRVGRRTDKLKQVAAKRCLGMAMWSKSNDFNNVDRAKSQAAQDCICMLMVRACVCVCAKQILCTCLIYNTKQLSLENAIHTHTYTCIKKDIRCGEDITARWHNKEPHKKRLQQ